MAHGYLGDGYGLHGDDGERDDRERNWRGRGENWDDRDHGSHGHDRHRGMMFGGEDRGWSNEDRWSDRGRRNEDDSRRQGFGGQEEHWSDRRSFSAHPDDHYRSWRDRHMSELDRDYADYCRERESHFHREFDDWRQQRSANPQPLRTGMTQTGMSHDPSGEFELTNETKTDPSGTDPVADATLGTTSSGSRGGRGR